MSKQYIAAPLLAVGLLLVWYGYVAAFRVSPFILPGPLEVLAALEQLVMARTTWWHVSITVGQTIVGFAVATIAGVAIGVGVGRVAWLERTLTPFVVVSQVVPKVALVPLFVVWFGFGSTSKVLISAVMAFFPVFTNTVLGMKSIEPDHHDVMTCLNATQWQRLTRLELPSAGPFILSGMEVGIVLAIIGVVVAQLIGGNSGLGFMLVDKMNAYETDGLFAVITLLAMVGLGFHVVVRTLRWLLVPWHGSGG